MVADKENERVIFVVEDIEDHYIAIKAILKSNNKIIYPSIKQRSNFIRSVRTFYDASLDDDLVLEAKENILNIFKEKEIEGFIIDYELEQNRPTCSGVSFYKNFIMKDDIFNRQPVLFLTGKKGNSLNRVQELIAEINKSHRTPIAYFLSKDSFKDANFRNDLEKKIKEIFKDNIIIPE